MPMVLRESSMSWGAFVKQRYTFFDANKLKFDLLTIIWANI